MIISIMIPHFPALGYIGVPPLPTIILISSQNIHLYFSYFRCIDSIEAFEHYFPFIISRYFNHVLLVVNCLYICEQRPLIRISV